MPAEDQIDISLMSIGVDFAGTKKLTDGAVTVTLTYNNLAPYMSLAPQNYDWPHAPESASGALSLRQKTGETGLFKFYSSFDKGGFTIGQKNLDLGGIPVNFKLANDNQFMNASWNSKLGDKWLMNAAGSFTNNLDDIHFDQTKVAKRIKGIYLKDVFTYPFSEKFSLKFGGEFVSKSFSQNIQMPAEKHDNSFTNRTFSGFTEAQIYASSKFVTRIGARVEYSDYLKCFKISPRLSAAYKVTDKSQFSVAYCWFYQNPVDDYLPYTSKLKPERADHYTFSFQSSANSRTLRV